MINSKFLKLSVCSESFFSITNNGSNDKGSSNEEEDDGEEDDGEEDDGEEDDGEEDDGDDESLTGSESKEEEHSSTSSLRS
jgi:hypothetical protein